MLADGPQKTVLIVEDDTMLQKVLTEKLHHEGFKVLCAQDGAEGLKIALEKHPDVITLDILMPGKDGIAFLDEIRKDAWGAKVHIIILTNLDANDKMISKVSEDQPSYYCIKSNTSLDELVSLVKRLSDEVST